MPDLGAVRRSAIALAPAAGAGRSSTQSRRTVYINGKFYVGVLNGVHRTADRLVRELDKLAAIDEHAGLDLRLLLPRRSNWSPRLDTIRKVEQRFGHHQAWEQMVLPWQAAGGVLINLANLAPLAHRRKLSMIHDAQFLISPESFPRRFRLGYKVLTPLIAATSHRVLTVSEYARDSLAAFKVSPHDKTAVIYNGADHILDVRPDVGVLDRLGLGGRPYALLFGSPAIYKNVQVVFEAFRQDLPAVQLVVLGSARASLEASGLRPPADAIFAGAVDDRALRALYEAALCLLFPSRTEGFGLPPVEAMLYGCPVIAAPAGAIPEVCRDAILYADIFTPADWVDQIMSLVLQPELARAKRLAGLQRATRFTWRAAAIRLLAEVERHPATPARTPGGREGRLRHHHGAGEAENDHRVRPIAGDRRRVAGLADATSLDGDAVLTAQSFVSTIRATDIAGLFPMRVSACVASDAMQEAPLFDTEWDAIKTAQSARRAEFAAGRASARKALGALGVPSVALPVGPGRAPVWPDGFVGSITHTDAFCAAVAGRLCDAAGLGLDAEPAEPLAPGVEPLVCHPGDYPSSIGDVGLQDIAWPKVIFSIKEAFYKCQYPLTGQFLEFEAAAVCFARDQTPQGGAFTVSTAHQTQAPGFSCSGRWRIVNGLIIAGVWSDRSI